MRTSWKKSPRGYGESFDRFSNIPDGLVHQILCFLPIKDLARTILVSKRFRLLCLSVPDLFFDFEWEVGNWTDWFLSLRNGAKLRRFVLKRNSFPFQRDNNIRVCNWIHNTTVICRAEELDLSFGMYGEECFSLPLSTFVRAIEINLCHGVLKLPSSSSSTISSRSSFSSLQVLKIRNTKIAHNLSEDWVSSLFPAIKKLNLERVAGIDNLNITSSSLECLKIVGCDLHRVVVSAESLHTLCMMFYRQDWLFRLYAPSLRKVHWSDNLVSFLGSSMCLQSANMDAPMLVESTAANKSEHLLVLLQFINHAKSVILPGRILEELFRQDSLQYELDNVQNLDLCTISKKDHKVPALASLFRRLPNLKTLAMGCLDLFPIGYESNNLLALEQRKFDIEYWESQDVSFIHQLNEANIEINKWAFEVGLIKYFIKHAKVLERMTVTFAGNIDISRSRPIREKLSKFYETFSDATLDFVLK